MLKTAKTEERTIFIQRLERGTITLYLLGKNLVMNRKSKKTRETLLLPDRSKNKTARQLVLKHNPPAEFRDSVYLCRDDDAPTLVHFPRGAFGKAMAQAALDTPGATKAEIGRLVKILDETVHIYGTPYLYMADVRQAGPARTPDIRTRAMFPAWACKISVQYIRGKIREQDIVNLMANAGDITSIGDGRTEKGAFLNCGEWELVSADDERWLAIVKNGGRKAQEAALANPVAIDADSEELLSWYDAEIIRREKDRGTTPLAVTAGVDGSKKARKQTEEARQ
jgi:hypothetical protein